MPAGLRTNRRQLVHGPTFDPRRIQGLDLWLDATRVGFPLVDADSVTTWRDLSGKGNDCTEATNKPLFKTSIANGQPSVRFDGTNDKLVSGTHQTETQPNFVILVAQCRVAPAATRSVFNAGTAATDALYFDSSAKLNIFPGGGTLSLTTTVPNVLGAQWDGSNGYITINGTTTTVSGSGTASPTGSFFIGCNSGGSGEFFDGDIFELLFFNARVAAADRRALEAYLKAKWGTP